MRGKAWAGVLGVAFMMLCGGMGLGCSETEGTDEGDSTGTQDPGGSKDPVVAGCGNHIVEAQETCDDGNAVDGDGCSAKCLKEGKAFYLILAL